MRIDCELVYKFGSLNFETLGKLLIHSPPQNSSDLLLDHKSMRLDELNAYFDTGKEWWDLRFDGMRFWPGQVESHALDFLSIEGDFEDQTAAVVYAEKFLAVGQFRHGRLFDPEYEHWENATQINLVEAAGKHVDKTKIRIDPDFGDKVIDISQNVGRRVLKQGYINAVGSVMWFHQHFLDVTLCKPDDIRWNVSEVGNEIFRVVLNDHPFSRNDGADGQLQRSIRRFIFDECLANLE